MEAAIASNLQSVRSRIDAAARRAGRDPSDIRLIAVSKTFGADHVRAAWAAGQRDFGENKVQEALQKIGETADMEIRWHLIGHLQSQQGEEGRHRVRLHPLGRFGRPAARSSTRPRPRADAAPDVLVQVDLAGEATKFGAAADEARRIVDAAAGRAGRAR